ncbi:monooxygenase [Fusarium albosuccineum]|uniref:Monooxygenase n=1 Tax=Fusarium albosuccineum TaxID=1237068 RepID=A0A8H4LI65_9HYPO|nr:monooxygenase [Fusarium albosuccineum]
MLETPQVNGTAGTPNEHYRVQVMISWPVKTPDDENSTTCCEMLCTESPKGPKRLKLFFKIGLVPHWDNHSGKITLAGDAAHAMTMYRGEAANHGILDAYRLCKALEAVYREESNLKEAIDGYEMELRERTSIAVLLSRQACLDAHDWAGLNENSAVLKKRAIVGV